MGGSIRPDRCVAEVRVGAPSTPPTVPRAQNGRVLLLLEAASRRSDVTTRRGRLTPPLPPPSPDCRLHSGFLRGANWIHRSLDKVHVGDGCSPETGGVGVGQDGCERGNTDEVVGFQDG